MLNCSFVFALLRKKLVIAEYVSRYATEEALQEQEKMAMGNGTSEEQSDSEESTLSDFSENETETMEL